MKNKSKNQIPNIIRKRVSEPLWFLVGPGGSVGPAPWGPDSLERPAPQPRWSRAPLWENQGCQLPLCSPFTGNQTTPQALNCPRSQPSHCWGGGAPTMCQMPWVPPPQESPRLGAEGQGLRPSLRYCSQWSRAESFLAIQADVSRLGLRPKHMAISQTLLPGGMTLLGTVQTGWEWGNRGEDPTLGPGIRSLRSG